MNFTCNVCDEEIIVSHPKCNACSVADAVAYLKCSIQGELDELDNLGKVIILGAAYVGEIRAYTKVLNILEKL